MTIQECIGKIDRYLKREHAGPFVADFQNHEDLASAITHYKVGSHRFLVASACCHNDELPQVEEILNSILLSEGCLFVQELSSFLKFRGEEVLKSQLMEILAATIQGHVVILTYQCESVLKEVIMRDRRLGERICIVSDLADPVPDLFFTAEGQAFSQGGKDVQGIQGVASFLESGITETLYVRTKKFKKLFPYALYNICDLKCSFDILNRMDSNTVTLMQDWGTAQQWDYALARFKGKKSWADVITAEFGNAKTLALYLAFYNSFDENRKWLFFIALKLVGAMSEPYLNGALLNAGCFQDVITNLYRGILELRPYDGKFWECYRQRKKLLAYFKDFADSAADFCKMVQYKEKEALYYVTDNTQQERELIVSLLAQYGQEYKRNELDAILKEVYPDLYSYMSFYQFNNDLLNRYFQDYKYQKVINKILLPFDDLLKEQALKREFLSILSPRSGKIEAIDCKNAQVYFVDALGVEFLSFIVEKCNRLGLMVKVTVCRCELPSITCRNTEFLEFFSSGSYPIVDIKGIDEIKHHGKEDYDYQKTKLPLHLIRELEIIEDLLNRIKVKLLSDGFKKAILISDHGASRLAVIHETESLCEMTEKGEHSGRCCKKSDVDQQPEFAVDADDYWALANYDRFKGGRKSSVEVHGGAALEEVTIPIIEITSQNNEIEIKLVPEDQSSSLSETPVIMVSYRKKAVIRVFTSEPLQDVRVMVDGVLYPAEATNNVLFHRVELTRVTKAKNYSIDVYVGDNLVKKGLSLVVQKEGATEKNIL